MNHWQERNTSIQRDASVDTRGRTSPTQYCDIYKISKNALMKIEALSEELKFTDVNDFSERFLKTASIIEKNLPVFKHACGHTDIITTIIEYLNNFGTVFKLGSKYDKKYQEFDIIMPVIHTIMKICEEREIQSFLNSAIIKDSVVKQVIQFYYSHLKDIDYTNEIILLQDSDLYAFINYLRHRKSILLSSDKIWIQEPIKEKFLWLVKEYFGDSGMPCPIYTFRTKKELFTASTSDDTMNVVSIWTEDVIFAKNLAMSLNRHFLFINTHMDFYDGIVLLPYIKQCEKTWHNWCKSDLDNYTEKLSMQKSRIYNLFYDGMWQRPVKGTYWIHNDSQWANATSDDIKKCIDSAKKGFEIWSTKSITCRMQVLSEFASMLDCDGNSVLPDIISKLIKFSCTYENSLFYSQSGGLEVTKIRTAKGVIVLKEEDETILFQRLMQILTVGNSVIVICDTNSCSLAPYCDMFLASKIPPGVINLLSNENIKELELALCGTSYASYAEQFFSENDLEKIYTNLTKFCKQIIMPLK